MVPFVGVLGNMVNRIRLITAGAFVWAAMSVAFGLSQTYSEVSRQPASPVRVKQTKLKTDMSPDV